MWLSKRTKSRRHFASSLILLLDFILENCSIHKTNWSQIVVFNIVANWYSFASIRFLSLRSKFLTSTFEKIRSEESFHGKLQFIRSTRSNWDSSKGTESLLKKINSKRKFVKICFFTVEGFHSDSNVFWIGHSPNPTVSEGKNAASPMKICLSQTTFDQIGVTNSKKKS